MRAPVPLALRCQAEAYYRGGRCQRGATCANLWGLRVCVQHLFTRPAKQAKLGLRCQQRSHSMRCTVKQTPAENPENASVPTNQQLPDGQYADHWVLCAAERAKGYVRPVRRSYIHQVCGVRTIMPQACAETYAREPSYYGSTFCCACQGYFSVGSLGQFVWDDGSNEKVGT